VPGSALPGSHPVTATGQTSGRSATKNGCSAATCNPLWTAALTDTSFASPAVANGMVYQGEIANGQYLAAYKLP
jgi:hypothetical protein